jgi:hypothetical protein
MTIQIDKWNLFSYIQVSQLALTDRPLRIHGLGMLPLTLEWNNRTISISLTGRHC